MVRSNGSDNPTLMSHQALRGIQQKLERRPLVTDVREFLRGESHELFIDQ